MPLTIAILQRLREVQDDGDITKYQLHLFGRITLEREYTIARSRRLPGGIARFADVHTKEVLIINDQTEGLVLKLENTSEEINLQVSFDVNSEDFLVFSSGVNDIDGFFELKYTSNDIVPLYGDE